MSATNLPSVPVVIQLRVDYMRREIMAALSPEALSHDVKLAVDQAIAAFDFERELREMVASTLRDALASAIRSAAYEFVNAPATKRLLADRLAAILKEQR